jgi:NADH:ubiquinone oxidoreductase subunit
VCGGVLREKKSRIECQDKHSHKRFCVEAISPGRKSNGAPSSWSLHLHFKYSLTPSSVFTITEEKKDKKNNKNTLLKRYFFS